MEPRPMMDRLEAVFSIVPKARAIADIGTDHGYLAVELINRNRADFVIAGDVHKGPLESAKEYVQSCGLIPFSMNNATQYCFIILLKGAVSKHLDTAPSINL